MLTIRCAKCRKKLFKYEKIGKGKVLRCFKERISHLQVEPHPESLSCACGEVIGIDKGEYYQMNSLRFTYTGKKENS